MITVSTMESSLFFSCCFLPFSDTLVVSRTETFPPSEEKNRKERMQKAGPHRHTHADPLCFQAARRMSQCRQASDPAAGVSDLSGSAGFTVTHSQGFAPYSACPAAWGRPLDLLFSFSAGFRPLFRMFRRLSVYHKPSPLQGRLCLPPPECILPRPTQKLPAPEPSPSAGSLLSLLPGYFPAYLFTQYSLLARRMLYPSTGAS